MENVFVMNVISGDSRFQVKEPTAVAVGKFDGVHVGHKKLLAEILEQKKNGLKACVFTFDPTPAVFFGMSDGKELTTKEEKRAIFEKMGVDILVEFPMNRETAGMAPEQFVSGVLRKQLNASFVAAGTDVSFGHKGAGNAELLKAMGAELGMEVKLIDKVCVDGTEISSTLVRETIEKGDLKLAERLLGEAYTLQGRVVHGKKLGHKLGMPTVNILPAASKLLPPNGVYYSRVEVAGEPYFGISNIGYKPTVSGKEKICGVETYIYDFDREIYGEEVFVSLCEFRREEKKFDSVEALKDEMSRDLAGGWKYFHNA